MPFSHLSYTQSQQCALACSAKINWFLCVSSRRPDGYHDLQTVMQRIDLYDHLSLTPRDDSLIECIDANGCCDCSTEDNIVFRAARLLQEQFAIPFGVSVTIEKNIPVGAGLGGGSSDAAAILSALISLWNISVNQKELTSLAVCLGADVPFFLGAPLALCSGIGEKIVPRIPREYNIVLWKPVVSLSTKHVYQQFDCTPRAEQSPDLFLEAYASHNIHAIGQHVWNNLAEAARECLPELNDMICRSRSAGAVAVWISGSGPTVVSLCTDEHSARQLYETLRAAAAPEDFLHCGRTLTE